MRSTTRSNSALEAGSVFAASWYSYQWFETPSSSKVMSRSEVSITVLVQMRYGTVAPSGPSRSDGSVIGTEERLISLDPAEELVAKDRFAGVVDQHRPVRPLKDEH